MRRNGLLACLLVMGGFASAGFFMVGMVPARAASDGLAAGGSLPKACSSAFPSASSTRIGKTILYNRQESVERVACDGFGQKDRFPITASMVCGIVAQAIGAKKNWEGLGLYVDGACSGAALAVKPGVETDAEVVCSWLSEILAVPYKAAGTIAGVACTVAPSAGAWAESKHERDVAVDIAQHGKCLKYSPSHFGSPWLAVACAASDPGFSTLPFASGTGLSTVTIPAATQKALHKFPGTVLVPTLVPSTWPRTPSLINWRWPLTCGAGNATPSLPGLSTYDISFMSSCPNPSGAELSGLLGDQGPPCSGVKCNAFQIGGMTYEFLTTKDGIWIQWRQCNVLYSLQGSPNVSLSSLKAVIKNLTPLPGNPRCG
jgi:hypothetical protein